MAFVVTPSTVRNPARLNLKRVGAQMLGRGFRVLPKGDGSRRAFWRILFDQAPFRYFLALSPFPIAMIIRPDLALAISQAPLLMFAIIVLLESSVLSISTPAKRRKLIPEADAARGLDVLRQRGTDVLSRLAAGRGLQSERLHLVLEQSGLARVPVLTIISVQQEGATPGSRPILLDLDADERAMLTERLFDESFTEKLLHTINLRENKYIRDVALDATAVTAHARLMALAGKTGQSGAPPAASGAPSEPAQMR